MRNLPTDETTVRKVVGDALGILGLVGDLVLRLAICLALASKNPPIPQESPTDGLPTPTDS